VIGLALAALALASTEPPISFMVARDREAPWPTSVAQFPGGVTAHGDITYAQPLHYRPLLLDLYTPATKGSHALVVYVHGGAWVRGTKREVGPVRDGPAVLAQLAQRGFVVAAVEYRLDGEAKFPAAVQDVKAAIRFLRSRAAEYGIDPSRVGIFGGSAGGQLAALAGTSCGVAALDPPTEPGASPPSDCVQAAAAWYGVHDFRTVPTPPGQTGPGPYLGCPTRQCPTETLRFASPVAYVDPKDPPFLLIHGLADKLVAVSQTREFEAALRAAGVPVKAIYIPGVDHGLVGPDDATTHAANLQALTATFEFFEETLKPGRK
jgi:acetyl esterase/lipase